jgi:periplasmic divalent cation tolerance protein
MTQKQKSASLYRFIYITASTELEAETIARRLVENRLAACVNIFPKVRSIYYWEGKIEDDSEVVIIAKTTVENEKALIEEVVKLHSYECPCVISLPIENGAPDFLKWIGNAASAQESSTNRKVSFARCQETSLSRPETGPFLSETERQKM